MSFLIILYFVLFVNSLNEDGSWSESRSETGDGIIYYTYPDDYVYLRNGWVYTWTDKHDYYTFNNSCCSANDMIMLIGRNDDWAKEIKFADASDSITMNSFRIINTGKKMKHIVNTENMKNGLNFYFGCFESTYYSYDGTDYICRTTLDKKTRIRIYSSSFTLFGDSVDQEFVMIYREKTSEHPYVFVGGIGRQNIEIKFELGVSDSDLTNGVYYLFTTDQSSNYEKVNDLDGYDVVNICSREDRYYRYGIVKDSTSITDCTCSINNGETTINSTTTFNYPDCHINSTILDLELPTTSNTFTISDYFNWYSIQFTTSSQSIQINEEETLNIKNLIINQDDISFNGNVNVKNLTISTIGASFDVLDFDTIDFSSITEDDDTLFTLNSTSTDLFSFELKQCEDSVLKFTTTYLVCNSSSVDFNTICEEMKMTFCNDLLITKSEYSINSNEYWNTVLIEEIDDVTITGIDQLKATVCEFENKTITIDGNLYCTTMNINSNTKLIINGELTVDSLVITNLGENLNENGIIELCGSISITSIEISTSSQSNCFEFISSTLSLSSLSDLSINSDYSTLLLSQNHLLRICPSTNTNYEVQCTTIGSAFEQESFDTLHCPCIDSNCIINVNTTQLDTRNVGFSGTFDLLTDSMIAISYKTSLFSIEYENDKQLLLLGNGAVGFNILNINSLKSEPTTLSIESSNQIYCKALLFVNDTQKCIIEDNTTYPTVGDINNCQLQNGYGCEICYEGYESNVTYCNECPLNCLRCYNGECINCEMNYQLNETMKCELIINPIEIFDNNKTMKCNDGYYSSINQCTKCDGNCITCNSSQCLTCNTNYTLNNGNCQLIESNNGEEIISNYGVIDCNEGYYSNNSQCIDCSLTFEYCDLCNCDGCLTCSENYVLIDDGSCSLNTNCLNISDSICLSCNDKGSWFNGYECIECGNNCKNCINGNCVECNDGYILQSENNCTFNEYPDNCIILSYYGTCQRCSDGYYLNDASCLKCPMYCKTCFNSTYCFECKDEFMISEDNECVYMGETNANCKTAIPGSSGGCAICNDGYYRNQTFCESCISNCTKCNNGESCLYCDSDFFLLNDASECISYDDLINCDTPSPSGCTKCSNGYYLNNQYCTSCDTKTENCNTCENDDGECLGCNTDYVLVDKQCIHIDLISSCTEVKDSKCVSCSFWHTPNSIETGCDTQVVWWLIVLMVVIILIVIFVTIAIITYLTIMYLDHKKLEEHRKKYTIFDMDKSNIKFIPTENKDVMINREVILFDDEDEIKVNEETRDLICVGNSSKNTIKVQFSVKEGCDKYEIRTNPQLMTIPKGKALEFEIFIKPLCTCKIDDQFVLISANLSKGKTTQTPIRVETQTVMTSHLDYDELIEEDKLGEGSFGIVYKGTFRGHTVAIKKMKNANDSEKAIEEFNREVAMLDKFRCEYIIHFYGAVMIPNKICMVTEFAQYGSVQDLTKKIDKPSKELRRKFVTDAAKGIQYLHSNVILHRDIKPDNILVISLDPKVSAIAKLTDFGSSRNVNSLVSNMTFTKGIGTPKFMAPEILAKEKYQLSSDVYSFGVTMYEIDTWKEVYPNTDNRFKFPWGVADFVTKGNRLEKPEEMEQDYYDIIDKTWKHDINERIDINETIKLLESL
ncbi:Protein serine/threonine kinase [Entamoeba marina]